MINKVKKKLILLIVSSVISAVLVEIVIRLVMPQDLSGSWRIQTEEGLKVNKSSGFAQHQHGDRIVRYSFSAPHLRGPLEKRGKTILTLGDSFTFGWLLNDEFTYVNLIQKQLDQTFGNGAATLWNASAGGWGTADHVAYVEKFGEQISPDMILLFINADDFNRAHRSGLWRVDQNSKRLLPQKQPVNKFKQIVSGIPLYQFVLENSHLMQISRKVFLYRNAPNSRSVPNISMISESSIERTKEARFIGEALISRLADYCENRGIRLVVTTTGWQNMDGDLNVDPERGFLASASAYFAKINVPFFDPTKDIQKALKNFEAFSIEGDGHPNEKGAELIAQKVTSFVVENVSRLLESK